MTYFRENHLARIRLDCAVYGNVGVSKNGSESIEPYDWIRFGSSIDRMPGIFHQCTKRPRLEPAELRHR